MAAEPKAVPTERGASDEAEREEMTIEIEDGDKKTNEAEETVEEAKTDAAETSEANESAAEQGESDADADVDAEEPAEAGKPDGDAPQDADADELMTKAAEALKAATEEAEKAKAEAKEWQDKFMRLHAEWDTYRRRTAEQREAEKARASEKLVTGLLPVIDDFERTIKYAEDNGEGGLLDGVRAVHTKFVDVLVKDGVQVIDPAGEAFDALQHQAVATVPDDVAFDETVHEVYQKGYKLGEKVLRPAMVTVTTGGPKRPKPDEAEEE